MSFLDKRRPRRRTVSSALFNRAAAAAVGTPAPAAEITLPAGHSFVSSADYVKVVATQQLREGRVVIAVHVIVTAHPRLTTPVVVSIEDGQRVDRIQVRPMRESAPTKSKGHVILT